MKINKIKINSYGNISDKEINLEKMNIIYGKNESGKSTIQNFILSTFYGIEKKKSKSDYDKYKPWNNTEEFSGKISYELDDKKSFEVYRNFENKNPEIYDENGKDISNSFNIDKKLGNTFFIDQIKLDRETLERTVVSGQNSLRISDDEQENLIQKVSNIIESGDEETSFAKAIKKLNAQKLSEVGTDKSQDRPINIAKKNIEEYEAILEDIENARDNKFDIECKISDAINEIQECNNKNEIYEKIKEILKNNNEASQKIKIKEDEILSNNEKILKTEESISNLEKKKNNKLNIALIIIAILINVLGFIFIKNNIVKYSLLVLIPLVLLYVFLKNKKNNSNNLNGQLQLLKNRNNELQIEIKKEKEELISKNEIEKNQFIEKYGEDVKDLFNSNIELAITSNQKKKNDFELQKHILENDYKQIEPKIERLSFTEEQLEIEKENLKRLEERQEEFDLTKELLEKSYEEMKKNITPKFKNDFEEYIKLFTDGKYSKVFLNDGIFVELKNGKNVAIDNLSFGTIQEIYLALRLAITNELSEETIPIILDEPFAYFDDDRLKFVLDSLSKINNQIIIFTCTEREKRAIEKLNVKYNYIEL